VLYPTISFSPLAQQFLLIPLRVSSASLPQLETDLS
jgi:hypothetical protein